MMRRFVERLRRFFWPKGYYIVVPKGATLYLTDTKHVANIECSGMVCLGSSPSLGSILRGSPETTTGNASQPPLFVLPFWPKTPKAPGPDPCLDPYFVAQVESLSRALLKSRAKPKKGFPAHPKAGGPTCKTCGWWRESTPSNPGGECYFTGYAAVATRPSCGTWKPPERKPKKKPRGKKRQKGKNRTRA